MESIMNANNEEKYFRWAYRLLVALAKRCQQDDGSMHQGQDWTGLVGSSHSMYFKRARDEAGIDHDDFLQVVRGKIDVEDIYEESIGADVSTKSNDTGQLGIDMTRVEQVENAIGRVAVLFSELSEQERKYLQRNSVSYTTVVRVIQSWSCAQEKLRGENV